MDQCRRRPPRRRGGGDGDAGRGSSSAAGSTSTASTGAGWALWTYKDLGLRGLTHARSDSPYVRRIAPVLEKKARLGADAWAAPTRGSGTGVPGFRPLPLGAPLLCVRRGSLADVLREHLT